MDITRSFDDFSDDDLRMSVEELNDLYERCYNPIDMGVSGMFNDYQSIEIKFMQLEISWETKNVNSKKLFQALHSNIFGWLGEESQIWLQEESRAQLAWLVDEYLADVCDNGHITQFNVVCDRRNNTLADHEARTYHFDVYYVQKNCLNTTKILYTIRFKEITL